MSTVLQTRIVQYPEGDAREIEHGLSVNQMVDLNGAPVALPLATAKTIVYRVWKVTTSEERKCEQITYHLELVTRPELEAFSGAERSREPGGRQRCS
jgi:hypothetical protein